MNVRQKSFLASVIVVNVLLWAIPSDVAELVSRDKAILLGRYSRTHFAWIVGILLISIVGLYIDQARTPATYKKRWFQVLATLLFLLPALFLVDLVARGLITPAYVRDTRAYHRPPHAVMHYTFEDLPAPGIAVEQAPAGYAPLSCTLTTDGLGYRNRSHPDHAAVVTLGDSFTEGSNVSDQDAWPVVFAGLTGRTVCNLGMTGYSPVHYVEVFARHGRQLSPEIVICMLYEGNDFHIKPDELQYKQFDLARSVSNYFDQSPLRRALNGLMIAAFDTGARPDPQRAALFSWLPLWIPEGPQQRPYAFGPKALLEHSESAKSFAAGRYWFRSRRLLERLRDECRSADARLVFVFAPTKAHVILPLVRDRLPIDKVRAFAGLASRLLPDADSFAQAIYENLDARENVVAQWCLDNDIRFLSLTEALRHAAANGTQVYFTYDHHWTPDGNRVAARAIADWFTTLSESPARSVADDRRSSNSTTGSDTDG